MPQISVTIQKAQRNTAHSFIQVPTSAVGKNCFAPAVEHLSTTHKVPSLNPDELVTFPVGNILPGPFENKFSCFFKPHVAKISLI